MHLQKTLYVFYHVVLFIQKNSSRVLSSKKLWNDAFVITSFATRKPVFFNNIVFKPWYAVIICSACITRICFIMMSWRCVTYRRIWISHFNDVEAKRYTALFFVVERIIGSMQKCLPSRFFFSFIANKISNIRVFCLSKRYFAIRTILGLFY